VIVKRFEEIAAVYGDKVAIKLGDTHLTYHGLNSLVNRVARMILHLYPGTGLPLDQHTVGLLLETGIEGAAAVLATLTARKIYVPLDPSYPVQRLEYMLRYFDIRLLVTDNEHMEIAKTLTTHAAERITLLDIQHPDPNVSSANLELEAEPDQPAYILHTSGSSGYPKGVVQTCGNLFFFTDRYIDALRITPGDRISFLSSFYQDGTVEDIYPALLSGAALYPFNIRRRGTAEIADWLIKERITVYHSVPTVFRYFTAALASESRFPDVRVICMGAEPLRPHDLRIMAAHFPCTLLAHMYGQTESSVNTMGYIDVKETNAVITLGTPLPGVELLVLNEEGEEVEELETGEIVVVSKHIALGYWKNPEATAKVFLYDEELGRMYRSGDLGEIDYDGSIRFMGRKDHQVKIRGFRVELGEIENRLVEHHSIKEAAVTMIENETGEHQLGAYIVTNGAAVKTPELREYLAQFLPDYMIPAYFILLERLPLTPGGKIDRKALPPPEIGEINHTAFVAPGNWVEIKLQEIWRDVLKYPGVIGIEDNFFHLGGHSLRATVLASRIKKALQVNVPLTEIFKRPTIHKLAAYISAAKKERYAAIASVEKKEYHALSPAQKRLYILHRMESESVNYNMLQVVPFPGIVDIERMQSVFRALIRRHESLRTSFAMINEEPVQRIQDEAAFEIEFFEPGKNFPGIPDTPGAVFSKKVPGLPEAIVKSFYRPFDISKAPLLRAGITAGENGTYVLLVDMHHIITDGTSNGILTDEFTALYEGKGGALSQLRLQYKDYAQWQNSEIQRAIIKEQETYWKRMYGEEVPVLNLPTDYPRPRVQSFEGSRVEFILNGQESGTLKALAKETGATLYISILSVFTLLLSRLSSQEDIVVGIPVAARRHADLEKIIGMFVNTLALRNKVPAEASYGEFAAELKDRALQAYENQEYQFEDLVEKINAARDISRNPVFDVVFNLLNIEDYTGKPPIIDPGNSNPYIHLQGTSKFDLTLNAIDIGERVHLSFEYCTRLFKPVTIQRFISYFKNILKELSVNPGQNLSQIEIVPREERDRILYEFNKTGVENPGERTIHELYTQQVERTPDCVALVGRSDRSDLPDLSGVITITYRELNEQTHGLAGLLIAKGVLADTIVGIMMKPSVEMIIGIMGILKAGGAYLPIDPAYPRERIEYMLADSSAKILVTSPVLSGKNKKLSIVNCQFLIVNEKPSSINNYQLTINNLQLKGNNLAYVIYTSGTTGRPKGVMIQHRALHNFIGGMSRLIEFKPGKIILALTTITFDIFGLETLLPLSRGLEVVLADENHQREMGLLEQLIVKNCVDMVQATPSRMRMFTMTGGGRSSLKNLKELMVGGEALPHQLLVELKQATAAKIYNMYGPTETTIWSTVKELTAAGEVNIGAPIQNTLIYILDKHNHLQPLGIPGELCIGGDGLARGYLNNPEMTVEKFDQDEEAPIGQELNAASEKRKEAADKKIYRSHRSHKSYLYRTGDLARWLPDGNIEFIGRLDYQIKIRGFRIEPGEIENRLSTHGAIKEAVVQCRDDETGNRYLCAYIVPNSASQLPSGELREFLLKYLPGYMIPLYFIPLERLPLTPNGKIDRKALPEPVVTFDKKYTAYRTKVEKELTGIWGEVLGIEADRIGIDINFFEIGGHSLKAIIMAAKVHKIFQVKLPLTQVFKTPYIKELSRYIEQSLKSEYIPVESAEKREYYALSSAQKRLHFIWQMDPVNTGYNMPLVFSLGKEIEKDKLETALRKLISRHESLRTSFERVDKEPVQRIHDEAEFEIEYYQVKVEKGPSLSIAPLPIESAASNIKNFIRPFDLSRAPLMRSCIIRRGDGNCTWLVDMHHIISDGASHTILTEDFFTLYRGKELAPLRLHYKDFSQWQNRLIAGGMIKAQEAYWLALYPDAAEIPRLNLPADYKRPGIFTFSGDRYDLALEGEEAARSRTMGAQYGATLYMNILAVLNVLFYKYTGQTDIIIGSGIVGRSHAGLQEIIGMFVNMLAMRNYPQPDKTYDSFLSEVVNNSVKSFENQDVQFEDLVDKLRLERDPARNPLFDISMVVQNYRRVTGNIELTHGDNNLIPTSYRNTTSKFDMTFFITEAGDDIQINIEYYTGLFKEETVQRLASHFKNVIKSIIKNPLITLKDIDIITAEEKQDILYEFNDVNRDYPREKVIPQLFEEQLHKTPDYIAALHDDTILTYRELDRRSSQLARYLVEGKIPEAESRVGIWMSQSLNRLISILGIIKAGGAYVPIDPSTPPERINFIIKDAGMGMVISEKNYLKDLNRLQWECDCFHSYLCMDSGDIQGEDEMEKNELMDRELWHHVGESARDDIAGGGWISSYTGEPLSRAEMDEYGDNVLKKLTPLLHPGMRVLEIGCASGITMYRIAPRVGFYYGTDLSRVIIDKNKKLIRQKGYQNIKLAALAAHEIHQIKEGNFDLIIMNSVIQCFHGHNYLGKVIRKCIDLLGETGYLFIGDIMDQEKKGALINDLRAFKQNNIDKHYRTKIDFNQELFVAKGFWRDLAAVTEDVVQMEFTKKFHTIENELTKFRYDLLITIARNRNQPAGKTWYKRKFQDDVRALSAFTGERLQPGTMSSSLAYIIYTSGTTGRPKGVMINHYSLVNLCTWYKGYYSLTPGDRCTQYASFGFDASVWETFPALVGGAALYLIPEQIKLDVRALDDYLEKNDISTVFLPTPICEQFMTLNNRSLRVVQTAGDKLKIFIKRDYRLYNNYGPTENTVVATACLVKEQLDNIPIGKPVDNIYVYILNKESLQLQPPGIGGELCIAGAGLARGYLNNPELTNEKFSLRWPGGALFEKTAPPGPPRKNFSLEMAPLYHTGDLARWLPDGNIEFLGRIDQQVKLRGFRIEPGEIETQLMAHPGVKEAVVLIKNAGDQHLCAYVVSAGKDGVGAADLKDYLSHRLPRYMVPAVLVAVDRIPLTPNGKVDRAKLLAHEVSTGSPAVKTAPRSRAEQLVDGVWRQVLERQEVDPDDNFFEVGGNSISIIKVHGRLIEMTGINFPAVKLFQYATIRTQARYLEELGFVEPGIVKETAAKRETGMKHWEKIREGKDRMKNGVPWGLEIAIIGISGVFPGAVDVGELWENLKNGVESISFFSDDEMRAVGIAPETFGAEAYARARAVVTDSEYFDADFFGYTPREAQIMDPQTRLFHQCVWHCLEDGGYEPHSFDDRIGLYAGASFNLLWHAAVFSGLLPSPGGFQSGLLVDKDFLSTHISYKMSLKGPGYSVQTACSTSLTAVHLAVQALLVGECEMALAGGVKLNFPTKGGYMYQEGMILSPDAHCRTFDAGAGGTVPGSGVAAVLLKPLDRAEADGDHIYAVIKGTAANNDGDRKVGFTAPSVEGQAEAIRAAHYMAGFPPETITYIEAHGTATELGDPVEIEALKLAFNTPKKQYCAIGSIKSNLGHLDSAAGAAGLIKTALALKHGLIPPSLHYQTPNPKLGLEDSPFYVVQGLSRWEPEGMPRRAGVSSLGIGGTNAHVVLEEYRNPAKNENRDETREYHLLLLSGKTAGAVERGAPRLAAYLEQHPGIPIADAAYTLAVGRGSYQYGRTAVCREREGVIQQLLETSEQGKPPKARRRTRDSGESQAIFLFPGQGAQYVDMARGLYQKEAVFREEMDRCFDILGTLGAGEIKEILYPGDPVSKGSEGSAVSRESEMIKTSDQGPHPHNRSHSSHTSYITHTSHINQTEIAQPALFCIEYALAAMLKRWGIKPAAMLGHSSGEYVAACISGVMTLEDALKLVTLRARLMQAMPPGEMLSVGRPAHELQPIMENNPGLSLAAVNGPRLSVLSGPPEVIRRVEKEIKKAGHKIRRLHTSHAFHSQMMEPLRKEFRETVKTIPMKPPAIPYVSNVSGDWMRAGQATDPAYWAGHLVSAVQFSRGLELLLESDNGVFIEVGPGRTLATFLEQQGKTGPDPGRVNRAINLVRHQREEIDDQELLVDALGQLWQAGIAIDWKEYYRGQKRQRVPLPGYSFEKKYYGLPNKVYRLLANLQGRELPAEEGTGEEQQAREAPPGDEEKREVEYYAPRDALETNLAALWREVLGIDKIGIYDNFFHLGGDSLTITQLMSRVREKYLVETRVKDFYQDPTVAALASRVKKLLIRKIKNHPPQPKGHDQKGKINQRQRR